VVHPNILKMKNLITAFFCCIVFYTASAQNTYTWNLAGGGNWNTSGNWTPARTSAAATDILIINNGGAKSITNVPTQTIGRLVIANNTSVSLSGGGGTQTLTISNGTGNDLIIESGSALVQNSNLENIVISSNCSADISGVYDVRATFTTTASGAVTTVWGELINTSVINSTTADKLILKNGAVYRHNRNGGNVPSATWETGSDFVISGVTNSLPGNLSQTFDDFEWNNPGQTTGFNLGGTITSVTGDFKVTNTNNYGLFLASNSGGTYNLSVSGDIFLSGNSWLSVTNGDDITATINIAGNIIMSGGYFDYHVATSGGTTLNKIIVNVNGDVSITGGIYDFAWGNSNAANFTELRLGGNLSVTGTGIFRTTTTDTDISNGTVYFNGPGNLQTFYAETPANVTYVNFVINNKLRLLSDRVLASNNVAGWADQFTVNSNGSLDLRTYRIISSTGSSLSVNSSFLLQAGAEIITANAGGVQLNETNGSVSTAIANRTYSSGANYIFNGSVVQNSGIFTTTPVANQVNNLTINNTAGTYSTGFTLQQPLAVNGSCLFTAGVITTSLTDILIINDGATVNGANNNPSNPSFVNGPVRKVGNDPFEFPVGKINAGYRPCSITAPTTVSDVFTAEYIRGNATALGTVTAPGLQTVSNCEYWDIDRTAGTSSVNVTLSWSSFSPCNPAATVTNLNDITVAHFDGATWNMHGSTAVGGTASAGSVTWNGVSNFSTFSLGLKGSQVPLSVKFTNLKAYPSGNANTVEWTINEESGVQDYEVQRSVDGNRFTTINITVARNNSGSDESYLFRDEQPGADKVFYRVRGNELNGTFKYSPIAKVVRSGSNEDAIKVYPNPVTGKQFSLQLNKLEKGNYWLRLINSKGQEVHQVSLQHAGGYMYRSVELPSLLPLGIYYLLLTGQSYNYQSSLIIQ
jgi:hypothetical protein